MTFEVIDLKTDKYPDLEHIARAEEWAQNPIPCDMEVFVSMRTEICSCWTSAGITHTVRRIGLK